MGKPEGLVETLAEAATRPIHAFLDNKAGRLVALAGILGAAGMIGRDCGREEGREQAFHLATNCVDAVYGEQFSFPEALPVAYNSESGLHYDLQGLQDACRAELELAIPNVNILVSALKSFGDQENICGDQDAEGNEQNTPENDPLIDPQVY